MTTLRVEPAARVRGRVRVQGDKSISHRAVLLGALAEGETTARGFLHADDTLASVACMRAMGVEITTSDDEVRVAGRGYASLREPAAPLDVGNSGTSMRLLAGVLAGRPFPATLTGDASIRRRPMERVAAPLRAMGATIETATGRRAPLWVRGGDLRPIRYELPVASAQVKSAILLAGLQATGTTTVVEPEPTRDHTERVLHAMGADLTTRDVPSGAREISVRGPARLRGVHLDVPADISSAAFFLVLAATHPDAEITLDAVGINPTRTGILDALGSMGARIDVQDAREEGGEPVATLFVRGGPLHGTEIGGAMIPLLVDEIPILAVAASLAEGETVVRDAAELRAKESDRIAAMSRNLRAVGVDCEERPDGLRIRGGGLRGGVVASDGDHRIAMAFAIAGALSSDGITVEDTACIDTSFPRFETLLRHVTAQ